MELSHVGTHCDLKECNRLDFLPYNCDLCKKTFCADHREYVKHSCDKAYTLDARVPICQICNSPIPVKRGDDPNIKVNEHIESGCKVAKPKTAYVNQCNYGRCKKKELIPLVCKKCGLNFCIQHSLDVNHKCEAGNRSPNNNQTNNRSNNQNNTSDNRRAANNRRTTNNRNPPSNTLTNGNMTEDEALQAALAASMGREQEQQGNCSLS